MGTVWEGLDAAGRAVAIKVMHERFANDPKMLARFVRERTVLTGLQHPNLVAVHDMIMEGDQLALVMDLVDGMDLERRLEVRGPFTPSLAAELMAQVCEALKVVHAAGVVHRDLKPSNILLDFSQPEPAARLTDFGIAWAQDDVALATSVGSAVGTPAYAAPEVVEGQRGTSACDVYAAGLTLYELLTARRLFEGGSTAAILWRQVSAEPLRPPSIPQPLWEVIAACLAKDPARRPSAATVASLLRQQLPALIDVPAAAPLPADAPTFTTPESRPGTGPGQSPPPGRRGLGLPQLWPGTAGRRPAGLALAGLAACLAVVMGVVALRSLSESVANQSASRQPGSRSPAKMISPVTAGASASAPASSRPARTHAPRTRHARTHRHAHAPRPVSPSASPTPSRRHRVRPKPHPVVTRTLYSFQGGNADGWQPVANVAAVTTVTSFLDGPMHPYGGTYALDAGSGTGVPLNTPRTMAVTPSAPLDLADARIFFLHFDGYGNSYGTGARARITLISSSGQLTSVFTINTNSWNRLSIGLSDWPGRRAITRISVSYVGTGGTSTAWVPHFQLDDVGYRT